MDASSVPVVAGAPLPPPAPNAASVAVPTQETVAKFAHYYKLEQALREQLKETSYERKKYEKMIQDHMRAHEVMEYPVAEANIIIKIKEQTTARAPSKRQLAEFIANQYAVQPDDVERSFENLKTERKTHRVKVIRTGV